VFEIKFDYDSRLDTLDEAIIVAVTKKLANLTIRMYEKVIENVSGKILNKQSGQLASSINLNFGFDGNTRMGEVFVDPASPKAWALEKGGERSYTIVPTKAEMLHWFRDEKHHFAKEVLHPPSKEYAYLRLAMEEMAPLVPTEMAEAIQAVLDGRPEG
jgi:hypothetical protein